MSSHQRSRPAHLWPAAGIAAILLVALSGTATAGPGRDDGRPLPDALFPGPRPRPTASTGVPDGFVADTINGALIPVADAYRATRHPVAVMVDDQAGARPQSGLSTADLVIQAPAEGGIPRYMAIFQAGDADAIGPIRSTRLYYVGWASEWNALYVHVGGAPNALAFLRQNDKRLVYNADEFRWGPATGYMLRIRERFAPHNVYSSTTLLRQLADVRGARSQIDHPAWTFIDDAPLETRPDGGSVVVPYLANRVEMHYDRVSNRYLRSVTNEKLQIDVGNGQPVAPKNVVVQFVTVGRLSNRPGESNNIKKGRLELGYIGSGRAIVMRNGEVISATWSKKADAEPTLFRYASGPQKGEPVALVRGQIFIQVVPTTMKVVAKAGKAAGSTP
jgi:hypothetical protein